MNSLPPLPILGLLIVGGLLLGSLLNIVIIRLPRERQLLRTPLHCTRTGEPLAWWQVIPLLGWLIQRGRSAMVAACTGCSRWLRSSVPPCQ